MLQFSQWYKTFCLLIVFTSHVVYFCIFYILVLLQMSSDNRFAFQSNQQNWFTHAFIVHNKKLCINKYVYLVGFKFIAKGMAAQLLKKRIKLFLVYCNKAYGWLDNGQKIECVAKVCERITKNTTVRISWRFYSKSNDYISVGSWPMWI